MIDSSIDFQETLRKIIESRIHPKMHQEKILQNIIEKHSKNDISDFQEMLKKSVKPLHNDILNKDLQPEIKKKDVNAKNINIQKQVLSGANPDSIVSNVDDKQGKNNSEKSQTDSSEILSKREEILKHIYSTALDEYYKLRNELYKSQIGDNNIALDDKNYLRLLKYENYIRKCDISFRNINGQYISVQDKQISEKESKYVRDTGMNEKKLNEVHEDSVNEVETLNNRIKTVADEIMVLNEENKNGNVNNYENKLENLENEYISLNAQLHILKPNILELYRQEQEREEQDEITTDIIGTVYGVEKGKEIKGQDLVTLDSQIRKKENLSSGSAEEQVDNLVDTKKDLAESYLDSAKTNIENGDIVGAENMVKNAQQLVGEEQFESIINNNGTSFENELKRDISTGNKVEIGKLTGKADGLNQTEKIDKHIEQELSKIGKNKGTDIKSQLIVAVYTPEKRSENVLKREATGSVKKIDRSMVR